MTPVQILHEIIGSNAAVVTVIGQLDESNVDERAKDIYAVIEKLPAKGAIIFNFSEFTYMNSKAIGYTMDFFNKMNEKEGMMIIAEPQEQIEDILNVVGASQVITIVHSLQEAKELVEEKIGIDPINNSAPISPVTQEPEPVEPTTESAIPVADINNEIASYLQNKQKPAEEIKEVPTETSEEIAPTEEVSQIAETPEPENIIFGNDMPNAPQAIPNEGETTIAPSQPSPASTPAPAPNPYAHETEFPILGVAVVIGLTIIILALMFK